MYKNQSIEIALIYSFCKSRVSVSTPISYFAIDRLSALTVITST